MDFKIPSYVNNIIDKLEEKGHSAYIVGGSVRDLLIGKEPNDYDVATSADTNQIEDIFSSFKTLEVGKQFGTLVIVQEDGIVEVTSFRKDGDYLDGRRPERVFFSKNLKDDLSRRDFTINALAYNKKTGIIDYFNGKEDIKNKIIRTVGQAKDRFSEDYLRIVRAIRFASQLGFTIEDETLEACKKYSKNIKNISQERIFIELSKILLSEKPSIGINLLKDTNTLEEIIPELIETIDFDQKNPYHDKDVYKHTLCTLDRVEAILHLRLAALFHDIGKPRSFSLSENGQGRFYGHDKLGSQIASQALKRLKASNEIINKVFLLVGNHMGHHNEYSDKGLKKLLSKMGDKEIFNLINLQKADKFCSRENQDIGFLLEREIKIKEIIKKEEPYKKDQLQINGNDLKEIGYKEGKIIGEILDSLLEKVIENPDLNQKEILIKIVKNI